MSISAIFVDPELSHINSITSLVKEFNGEFIHMLGAGYRSIFPVYFYDIRHTKAERMKNAWSNFF